MYDHLNDYQTLDWLTKVIKRFWADFEPDLVSVIAVSHGWNPLEVAEKMTVHMNGKEYEIKRTK